MKYVLILLCLALSIKSALAASFSFAGSFTQDDNVQLFQFSVATTSSVTLRTWSYAGGTNAAGLSIPEGGFDTYLTLFNGAGLLLADNDDGSGVAASPITNSAYDALIQSTLAPGNYMLALSQFDNFAIGPNLSNGFLEAGAGNYTVAFGCSNRHFCDIDGNNRTAAWALDVLNVASASGPGEIAPIPEPASIGLSAAGLVTTVWALGRRRGESWKGKAV